MSIKALGRFVGFDTDPAYVPEEGEDLRLLASGLVREADEIKSSVPRREEPWRYDNVLCNQVLPRYLTAIFLLGIDQAGNIPDAKDAARQRAGYVVDMGLALLGALSAYRGRQRQFHDLGREDLARCREIRDLAIGVMGDVLDVARDAAYWFNLGSLQELAGNATGALQAFGRAAEVGRGTKWREMALEAVEDVRAGNSSPFPG